MANSHHSIRAAASRRLAAVFVLAMAVSALSATVTAAQDEPRSVGAAEQPPREAAPAAVPEPERGDVNTGMRRYVEIRSLVILHDECGFLDDYSDTTRQAFDRAVRDSVLGLRQVLPYYDRQALNEIIRRETLAAHGDCGPGARGYFASRLGLVRDWN